MAEIEFKRRGTPVWAVVLVLLVIAGVLYALFGRHRTAATADSTSAAAPTTGTGATAGSTAPGAATAPAAPMTPVAKLGRWADSASAPSAAPALAAYVSDGLHALADAVQDRAPMAGVQYLMIRAMADTVAMPTSSAQKQLDDTQAAFFAAQYALRDKPGGARLEPAAQAIDLKKPLTQQRDALTHFFKTAADVLRDPSKGLPPSVPTPGATAGAVGGAAAPKSPSTPKTP